MRRSAAALLVFSLALNVGLLSASFTHWWHDHRAAGTADADLTDDSGAELQAPSTGRPGVPGEGRGFRQGRGPRDPNQAPRLRHWPERRVQELARQLDLSGEQRERLETALMELRPRMLRVLGELAEARRDVTGLLASPAADRDGIRRGARRSAELQAELDELVAEAMLREVEVLDEAQRARYREMELNTRK